MISEKLKLIVKRNVAFDSNAYIVLKKIWIASKNVVDFFFFKVKYPNAKWYSKFYSSGHSWSQYGQDQLILSLFNDDELFYVEIGANHPTRLNNSFLLEKNGWRGVSIDPLKKYIDEWCEVRLQPFVNVAIGRMSETRTFVEFSGVEDWIDMMSGFEEFIREEDYLTFESESYPIEVKRLEEVIEVDKIDLLLMDVEGAEMEILSGIDFDRLNPSYILIENASEIGGGLEVRRELERKSYRLIARIGCADDLFEYYTNE